MRDKLIRFMQGRYGVDQFSKFLMYFGVVIMFITILLRPIVATQSVDIQNQTVNATDSMSNINQVATVSPAAVIISVLFYLAIAVVIFSYVRIFSRNFDARYRENNWYLRKKEAFRSLFSGRRAGTRAGSGTSSYSGNPGVKIYKCPSCNQKVRVPRGKGKIQITCPKCHVKFIKRT